MSAREELSRRSIAELPAFANRPWQMSFGERAALEGLVAQLEPRLALEIGTAEGGSLRRIAAHSEHVISFDLVEPAAEIAALPNVELRTGDSHALLPAELERLAAEGRSVDFILVDGDHTAAGVRLDFEHILASEAARATVVLAHDTLNPEVRAGLEAVDFDAHGHVAWVDLDFVPGYVATRPPYAGQCWGGLGLVIIDPEVGRTYPAGRPAFRPMPELVWPSVEGTPDRPAGANHAEVAELRAELERHRAWLASIKSSPSWRLTEPLRRLKHRARDR